MGTDIRALIFAETLKDIPFQGFSDAVLMRAAERVGVSRAEARAAFPDGPASFVEAFSHWADRQMETHMQSVDATSVRGRIARAVRARLGALAPHKEATRRAAVFLALPPNALLAAKLMFRSVDAMWRAAGDRSSDFNYYTKRGLLAGVYASTFVYWFSDFSEDHEATWKFLDARIGDVMNIQKMRSNLEQTASKLPDLFGILASLRRPPAR